MLEIKGEYGKDCKIFIDEVETSAMSTIYSILNHPVSDGKKVRIMPDVHDGVDIVIGFTMPLGEMVNPNHIGVDIGCGVLTAELPNLNYYSLQEIDEKIRKVIPMGFTHRQESKIIGSLPNGIEPTCKKLGLDYGGVLKQIGTLGGGNHYVEIGTSRDKYFLSIHSGSRNFGLQVCKYHAKQAQNHQKGYSYLSGDAIAEYISDMKIAQEFALLNRRTILHEITKSMGFGSGVVYNTFDTIHNYIDMQRMIIRKGAISAELGEKVAIPMNMRDGVLICVGKGNEDWNFSAPHGAGRIMSRSAAKKAVNIEDFKNTMSEVYSSSVNEATLDESPFAYKDMNTILDCIKDTVEVIDIVKPILNIKA